MPRPLLILLSLLLLFAGCKESEEVIIEVAKADEVVKVEVTNHKIATTDRDGNAIYSEIPDRYDMLITLKCKANETEKDIKVSNVEVQIGRTMLIESKFIRFKSVV